MKNRSVWIKIGVLLVVAVAMSLVLKAIGLDVRTISPKRVQEFVLSFGVWAPLVYIVAYGQPLLPLPASLMTGLAGAAFGRGWGTVYAVAGASVRAGSEFFVARLLGRRVVEQLLKGKVAALDQKLGENSFKAVLLIRLIPNFPFDVQNYGLGFSKVRAVPYLLATFLGILPGSFAFVYLGESLVNPRQIWKLGVAILLVAGLMVGTSAWKRKRVSE